MKESQVHFKESQVQPEPDTQPTLTYRPTKYIPTIQTGFCVFWFFESEEQQQHRSHFGSKRDSTEMNSGHPQYEQQPQRNWLEIAKRKWSGASITGSGRYSVRLMDGKNIRLFETFESAAEFCSQSTAYRFTDLAQEPPAP